VDTTSHVVKRFPEETETRATTEREKSDADTHKKTMLPQCAPPIILHLPVSLFFSFSHASSLRRIFLYRPISISIVSQNPTSSPCKQLPNTLLLKVLIIKINQFPTGITFNLPQDSSPSTVKVDTAPFLVKSTSASLFLGSLDVVSERIENVD
jgi:hypothetical protein